MSEWGWGSADQNGAKNNVTVLGYPKLPEAEWNSWLSDDSDHGMLYFEVLK